MLSEIDKRKNGRKPVIYNRNTGDKPDEPPSSIEDLFEYIAACPVCGKRIFDVSDIPGNPVRVRLKCPHCRKIVRIPISEAPPQSRTI